MKNNLDLLNEKRDSVESLRDYIVAEISKSKPTDLIIKENLLKEKEHELWKLCKKDGGHDWLPYNYHQIRAVGDVILPNPIDEWSRRCKVCGYIEVTHIIPKPLAKENQLVRELKLLDDDLKVLQKTKDNIISLKSLKASDRTSIDLNAELKKIEPKISRRNNRILKINKQLESLRQSFK